MFERNQSFIAILAVGMASVSVPARAVLLDNFDSYTVGQVDQATANVTGGVWATIGQNNAEIRSVGGNLALTLGLDNPAGDDTSHAWRALPSPVADNTTATVYFRFRSSSNDPDVSFGLSDVPTPGNNYPDYEAQARIVNSPGFPAGLYQLESRNGPNFELLQANLMVSTWYNIWMVINSTTNTWDAYLNTGGADATAGNLIASNITWRNGAANTDPLVTFLAFANTMPNFSTNIDDINISPGVNLQNFNPLLLGDTDSNGTVQYPQDFVPIRDNFQKTVSLRSQGDLNADGLVNFVDFREWKLAFLSGGGSLEGIDLSFLGGAVPEPTSVCLVFVAACGLLQVSARRRGN